jgi:hypothetical protein
MPSVDKTPPLINTVTLKSMLKAEAICVFGDFTEDFIVTCGAYSNSADIAVVINIGLTGDNGDEW